MDIKEYNADTIVAEIDKVMGKLKDKFIEDDLNPALIYTSISFKADKDIAVIGRTLGEVDNLTLSFQLAEAVARFTKNLTDNKDVAFEAVMGDFIGIVKNVYDNMVKADSGEDETKEDAEETKNLEVVEPAVEGEVLEPESDKGNFKIEFVNPDEPITLDSEIRVTPKTKQE